MNNELITKENLNFVKRVVLNASKKNGLTYSNDDVWILTGSYAVNAQRPKSDIDLILVKDNMAHTKPVHNKFPCGSVTVSISIVNKKTFEEEGKQKYGGYFAGKIINPHCFLGKNRKLISFVKKMGGRFIGDYVAYLGDISNNKDDCFTKEQVAAQTISAYMTNNPGYDSYFLSYFLQPNFDKIWRFLVESTTELLLLSEKIVPQGYGYKYKGVFKDYPQFHEARTKAIARKFGFGVYFHDSNYNWPESHFLNAALKIKSLDPTGENYMKMLSFLKKTSNLDRIFI